MTTPVRELRIFNDLRAYISDVGAVVLEQTCGDPQAVFFEPSAIDEVVAVLRSLRESALARQAMAEVVVSAEYEAWQAGGSTP